MLQSNASARAGRMAVSGRHFAFSHLDTAWGLTCEEMDNGGGLLEDYVDAGLALAEELDIEAVDLYHDFFPHESWEDWELNMMDGLHPNEAGREKIARRIADALQSAKAE